MRCVGCSIPPIRSGFWTVSLLPTLKYGSGLDNALLVTIRGRHVPVTSPNHIGAISDYSKSTPDNAVLTPVRAHLARHHTRNLVALWLAITNVTLLTEGAWIKIPHPIFSGMHPPAAPCSARVRPRLSGLHRLFQSRGSFLKLLGFGSPCHLVWTRLMQGAQHPLNKPESQVTAGCSSLFHGIPRSVAVPCSGRKPPMEARLVSNSHA
ncbi:hypothetical protein VTI74DRAFT_1046 [Chaetomium olivicolor]